MLEYYKYLIDNKLIEDGELVSKQITNCPYYTFASAFVSDDEAKIILGAIVNYMRVSKSIYIDDRRFHIVTMKVADDGFDGRGFDGWNICYWLDASKDGRNKEITNEIYNLHAELDAVYSTIDFLMQFMAGSNVSYLADGIIGGVR